MFPYLLTSILYGTGYLEHNLAQAPYLNINIINKLLSIITININVFITK